MPEDTVKSREESDKELSEFVEVKIQRGRLIGLRACVQAYAIKAGLGEEPDLELPFVDDDGQPLTMSISFKLGVVLGAQESVEDMMIQAGMIRRRKDGLH